MSKHNYIIAITGKSSSGKDSIARVLASQHEYEYVVSTTSRPMRSNENNHIDYHFVSSEEFQELINNEQLIEYRYYDTIKNGEPDRWHYGIERDEIDLSKGNYVVVVDLIGLEDLKREFGARVISLYIDVPEYTRKLRAIARDRNFEEDEWIRRNEDDDIKFKNVINKVDKIVSNNNFDECVAKVLHHINQIGRLRQFYTQYCSY